ncbi:MAG: H-NS histone family protein [Rhodoferax sp.]|uniref:H-NS histone family protein n=1 Tax=Rhodoferax sp. TaxID=50421 RepID=UPI00260D1647|nr:H-NS histone family protein [Rhodoferax sp.]MDD2880585.1 H-NS histone family protein [Rhodoferax sp.]
MSSLIDIQKQIAELQAQEAEIKEREFNEKVIMIKETMASYGITVEDLQGKPAKATRVAGTKSANPAPAKFKGPNGESWSGRGLAPKWMAALISEGHAKEEYLINK